MSTARSNEDNKPMFVFHPDVADSLTEDLVNKINTSWNAFATLETSKHLAVDLKQHFNELQDIIAKINSASSKDQCAESLQALFDKIKKMAEQYLFILKHGLDTIIRNDAQGVVTNIVTDLILSITELKSQLLKIHQETPRVEKEEKTKTPESRRISELKSEVTSRILSEEKKEDNSSATRVKKENKKNQGWPLINKLPQDLQNLCLSFIVNPKKLKKITDKKPSEYTVEDLETILEYIAEHPDLLEKEEKLKNNVIINLQSKDFDKFLKSEEYRLDLGYVLNDIKHFATLEDKNNILKNCGHVFESSIIMYYLALFCGKRDIAKLIQDKVKNDIKLKLKKLPLHLHKHDVLYYNLGAARLAKACDFFDEIKEFLQNNMVEHFKKNKSLYFVEYPREFDDLLLEDIYKLEEYTLLNKPIMEQIKSICASAGYIQNPSTASMIADYLKKDFSTPPADTMHIFVAMALPPRFTFDQLSNINKLLAELTDKDHYTYYGRSFKEVAQDANGWSNGIVKAIYVEMLVLKKHFEIHSYSIYGDNRKKCTYSAPIKPEQIIRIYPDEFDFSNCNPRLDENERILLEKLSKEGMQNPLFSSVESGKEKNKTSVDNKPIITTETECRLIKSIQLSAPISVNKEDNANEDGAPMDVLSQEIGDLCLDYIADSKEKKEEKISYPSQVTFFKKCLAQRLHEAANDLLLGNGAKALALVTESPWVINYETDGYDRFGTCIKGRTLLQMAAMIGDVNHRDKMLEEKDDHGMVELLKKAGRLTEEEVAKQVYPVLFSDEAKNANETRKNRILTAMQRFGESLINRKNKMPYDWNGAHTFKSVQTQFQSEIDILRNDLIQIVSNQVITAGYILDPQIYIECEKLFHEYINCGEWTWTFEHPAADFFCVITYGLLQYISAAPDARMHLTGIHQVHDEFVIPSRNLKNAARSELFAKDSKLGLDYFIGHSGKESRSYAEENFSVWARPLALEDLYNARTKALKHHAMQDVYEGIKLKIESEYKKYPCVINVLNQLDKKGLSRNKYLLQFLSEYNPKLYTMNHSNQLFKLLEMMLNNDYEKSTELVFNSIQSISSSYHKIIYFQKIMATFIKAGFIEDKFSKIGSYVLGSRGFLGTLSLLAEKKLLNKTILNELLKISPSQYCDVLCDFRFLNRDNTFHLSSVIDTINTYQKEFPCPSEDAPFNADETDRDSVFYIDNHSYPSKMHP